MPRDHGQRSVYAYSGWEIDLTRREVRLRGAHVPLGGRAFDIVAVLVGSAGELVTKEELLEQIWSGVFVEEIALRVHIAAIRKAFGADRGLLETAVGRGYRLLGSWEIREPTDAPKAAVLEQIGAVAPLAATNIPTATSGLIGRADIIAQLQELLSAYRVITLTGPGGIGKTVLALEAARSILPTLDGDCVFVELASVSDPKLVPSAVARTLSLKLDGEETSADAVARTLGNRRMLLVLDNCEHVVDAVAPFAETIVGRCPSITILTTSRETLRIDGEYVCRVPPLEVPSETSSDGDPGSPAVELFLIRAKSLGVVFKTSEDLAAIASICRRLDGIPLAIEFAAARAVTLGAPKVAASLDDRFNMLTTGRRTALPRHRTLRATLDWSYELLGEAEARALRRLAVFAKEFSLEAAVFVAGGDAAADVVTDQLAGLAAKSLVAVDLRGDRPQYRLLDTTRAYAMEKLRGGDEYRHAARRLAEFYIDLFARADAESRSMPQAEWLAIYAPHLDNVRAGLDWAFSADGDAVIGVTLMASAVSLWVQLSMLAECRERVERALATLDGTDGATARLRMQLSAALGWSLMYGVGRAREARHTWTDVLELAERLDDRDYRLRALWGLCIDQFNNGQFQKALQLAERFRDVAATSTDAIESMMADRLFATTLHYIGDQNGARHHIDSVISQLALVPQRTQIVRFSFDVRVSSHYFQARILWLQGLADQALRVVAENIEEGRASGHALTFCSVLGQGACPLAYYSGDLDGAELYCAALLDHTERHPIRLWHLWAQCFKGMLMVKRGDIEGGLAELRRGLDGAGDARFLPRFLLPLGELAIGLGQAGQVTAGLAIADDALARCETRGERWFVPELLRIKGELLLREAAPSSSAAEHCFAQALALAEQQGALFWQLRSSLNLARLRIGQGRTADARAAVQSVYEKFTEGFDIADLREARSLLQMPAA